MKCNGLVYLCESFTYVCLCACVCVQVHLEVWMDVHGCIREGQKTTLALIPQVPSSLVFKMGSLAGLELAG